MLFSMIAVTHDWPHAIDDDRRVVAFRPRRPFAKGTAGRDRRPRLSAQDTEADSVVPGLAEFERCGGEDDYRHRMTINLIVLAVNLLLITIGVWLLGNIRGN